MRVILLSVVAAGLWGLLAWSGPDGCRFYWPTSAPLIAHAGGGLPNQTYANSFEAINLAYRNGHRMIELDMQEQDGRIWFGHDERSGLTLPALLDWLSRRPDVLIVTDFKSDNVAGLTALAKQVPDKGRFIPQIYHSPEYEPVSRLGFPAPIFSAGRKTEATFLQWVNSHDVRAVTVPWFYWRYAQGSNKPVYLHTVNVPIPGFGYYTDCLIPRGEG